MPSRVELRRRSHEPSRTRHTPPPGSGLRRSNGNGAERMNERTSTMQHTDADVPAAAAPPDLPTTLTAILSEHLSGQDVGPDHDFYALGGDSLIALRVVASAQQHG